ncbi:NAD(P)-dependent alcohol dehydrogenase [Xanthomonas campestris pv. plantaginis]|uniref:zinc-dependent alcohol dehydrogenase family protein n=1 Tax=Xanthomonas campestris TaxID=339 RepID=UPI002B2373F5|nr:NAD(P)-dependent alcohol dehydrogenase [Xanthomonas campestris]MEA9608868.1 NAD(P)-dependent alcohol dehydrogenase [Xanthomonas campestris pv. plantaginis]
MQVYRVTPGSQIEGLQRYEEQAAALGHNDVRVRVRAVSLNYRDLMLVRGRYGVGGDRKVIPCSDGAGEVIAVGSAVTEVKAGDRVAASFFPHWNDGRPTAENCRAPLGAYQDGMLAQEVTLPAHSLVRVPPELTDVEAATLPCAGVTAWNALFVSSALRPGETVLLLGTGGVSIFALQLAHAAGLRTIITSSSDAKLERARALGAQHTINYRSNPEWQDEVLRFTGGRGVDLVVEVGGENTLERSVQATAPGGNVAVIGGVSGFAGKFAPFQLVPGSRRLSGVNVGSRKMLEDLAGFIAGAGIKPVVDQVFGFDQAIDALKHLDAAGHFGKLVVRVD